MGFLILITIFHSSVVPSNGHGQSGPSRVISTTVKSYVDIYGEGNGESATKSLVYCPG